MISIKEIASAIKVKNYKSAFKIVNRLKDKAGFVEMTIRIKYNLNMLGLEEKDYNLHDFSKVISDYKLHLAMSPTFDETAQNHLDAELDKLQQTGSLAKIIKSY